MSGMKMSSYSLVPALMDIMSGEIERELQTRKEEIKRKKEIEIFKKLKNDINVLLTKIDEQKGNKRFSENTCEIIQKAEALISENTVLMNESELRYLNEKIIIAEDIKKEIDKAILILNSDNNNENENININEKNIDEWFSILPSEKKETEETKKTVSPDKTELLVTLKSLLKIPALPAEYIKRIEKTQEKLDTIENLDFLKNFDALTVKPLEKECENFKRDYERFGDEYTEFEIKYRALCEMLGEKAEGFCFSAENTIRLRELTTALRKKLESEREQTYINDTVDEVMKEMGYDLLGEREKVKKSGIKFKDELFSFGDGTVINIRYSSDGKIAMEVGGLAGEDRLPSDNEREMLKGKMESFCGEFEEIEKRLSKKGLVCKNKISRLPPSEEYAQIINASEFVLKEKAEMFNISGGETRKKRGETRKEQSVNYGKI